MPAKLKVVGIGAVCVDQVSLLPHFPQEDTKIKANSYYQQVGGPVAVALMYLNRLGVNASLIASIGDDQAADYIKQSLPKLNQQSGRQTAVSQVWINQENGTRTIAYNRGTLAPMLAKSITEETLKGSQILHFDAQEPEAAAYAAGLAHELKITVTYDTGDFKPQSETLLKKADVVISPKRFGKTAQQISRFGPKIAIVTDGANGLTYSHQGKTTFLKSYKVKAVETVGAGDIFSGALIYSLLKKMPLDTGVRFASAAAAIKCSKIGRYFASEKEVKDFLVEMEGNEPSSARS